MRRFGLEFEFDRDARVSEFSMQGWRVQGEHCGYEIVSPILTSLEPVRAFCKRANELGFCADVDPYDDDDACGLHLHIEMKSKEEVVQVVQEYHKKQDYFFKRVDPYRHTVNWCEPLSNRVLQAEDYDELLDAVGDRYHWVNPWAFEGHGTLEIRLHQGTASYGEVSRWVRLHQAFIERHSVVPSHSRV